MHHTRLGSTPKFSRSDKNDARALTNLFRRTHVKGSLNGSMVSSVKTVFKAASFVRSDSAEDEANAELVRAFAGHGPASHH